MEPRWEHFRHQADVGVRGFGASTGEAFQQAALALSAIVAPLELVTAREVFEVECEANDPVVLLVDWLNTVIYEMATRRMLFSRYDVWVGDSWKLRARIWGEGLDVSRHQPALEVKAATYHQAAVGRDESGVWVAECVLDV